MSDNITGAGYLSLTAGFLDKLIARTKRYFKITVIILTPIILIPCFYYIEEPNNLCDLDPQGQVTCHNPTSIRKYVYTLLLMAIYWLTDIVPNAITAFLPLILFPVLGILPAREVAPLYTKDVVMLFVGGLMLVTAIDVTGLHKRVSLKILSIVGTSPFALMFSFSLVTWFSSMWISNTATVSLMMPIAENVFQTLIAQEEKRSRNIKKIAQKDGDSTKKQVSLKVEKDKEEAEYEPSPALKKIMVGISLIIPYSANIGGLATITGTPPNLIMINYMMEKFPDHIPRLDFAQWFVYGFPISLVFLLIMQGWFYLIYVGIDIKLFDLTDRYLDSVQLDKNYGYIPDLDEIREHQRLAALAKKVSLSQEEKDQLQKVLEAKYQKLPPFTSQLGEMIVSAVFLTTCLLWFFRSPGFGGWAQFFKARYVSDATVVLASASLLFILPKTWPRFDARRDIQPTETILTWKTVEKKLPWGIVFLIGGSYALSAGSSASGFSSEVKSHLTNLKGQDPWLIALVITIVTGLLTEFTSNTSSAGLLVGIIGELADAIHVNPMFLLMPMTMATSCAFMFPIATPPNAIAFSYNRLSIKDMIKCGTIMNLVGFSLIALGINSWGRVVLEIDDAVYPDWAANVTATHQ